MINCFSECLFIFSKSFIPLHIFLDKNDKSPLNLNLKLKLFLSKFCLRKSFKTFLIILIKERPLCKLCLDRAKAEIYLISYLSKIKFALTKQNQHLNTYPYITKTLKK